MPIICCPHCGARRNTPIEKLPHQVVTARCPECRQSFRFDPRKPTPPPRTTTSIACPHCGLPRELPGHRQTEARATVDCRRCQRSFQLPLTTRSEPARQPSPRQLRSIGKLLTDSWELFCRRGWGLLAIYLLTSLLILMPLALATAYFGLQTAQQPPLLLAGLLTSGIFALSATSWLGASMFCHTCDPQLSVFGALKRGVRLFWPFSSLLLLLGLIVAGGSLLLILPGILFSIWFCFSQYILAEEGLHGLKALERSRQLVRGHWWAVCGRFTLLLLVAFATAILTSRLPLIGAALNFAFSLLLTPFALIYCYLIYQDLKAGRPPQPANRGSGLPLATALLGWMLIPGLLFAVNNWRQLPGNTISIQHFALRSQLSNQEQGKLLEQLRQPATPPTQQAPSRLTRGDYEKLLASAQPPRPEQGVTLGPFSLSADHFWSDAQEPHLWLRLQLNEFPNLALAHGRSTRILIDKVLDSADRDRYDRGHSFENDSFRWVDLLSDQSESPPYHGIRNVYLKPGTRPEQIRRIIGQLELKLPLGIESRQLDRSDIGKPLQIAGKRLTLEQLDADGVTLRFQGERSDLLSVRANNQDHQPLWGAGHSWQKMGAAFNLRQMFSGQVDSITVLVASDSVTRSYPFEITR